MKWSRRESLALLSGTYAASSWQRLTAEERPVPLLATNTYPWSTFARREGGNLTLHSPELLGDIASTGLRGYEPIIEKASELDAALLERLKEKGLVMKSLYVNSVLHDEAMIEESLPRILAIAEAAVDFGTEIIVTNPSPIRWGGAENKSDAQLRIQAAALENLGGELAKFGMRLAYHNHDAELREGAREFHHMLAGTDPEKVKFCLDAHWIFRGCGNSEVAVFDVLELYRDRVVELHLRQSSGGTWNETFALEGDIDYRSLIRSFADQGVSPHLVLEQAVENGSPAKLGVVEAHRRGREELLSLSL